MQKRKDYSVWLPLAIAISTIVGIIVGNYIGNPLSSKDYSQQRDRKLNTILNLITQEYIDDISTQDLIEMTVPHILSKLDPHSSYLSNEVAKANNLPNIGINFQLVDDTIMITEVLPGGPSDKAGLKPGDKIVTIGDSVCVGPHINSNKVRDKLRGAKGSKVKIGISRVGTSKQLDFVITRRNSPLKTVDSYYMIDKTTGYVKVSQFEKSTLNEFVNALNSLKNEGAKRFIIDLRDNGGGDFNTAILMANEFLTAKTLIATTQGRYRRDERTYRSDGYGRFQDQEIVVLIDEFSASASEVFAGAIQDNDRGLIVGCRSFGKGLMQSAYDMSDKSMVILSVANYYTPSGRCIQKPFHYGDSAYQNDILNRYSNGELYSKDSIKIDKSKIFETTTGRKVYGGGGIIPDIFVPRDTSSHSAYFAVVNAAGLIQEFSLKYFNAHKAELTKMDDYKQLLRNLPANDDLLNDFVRYAANKGVPVRWYYIHQSQDLITSMIKGFIARCVFGHSAYYPIVNRNDKTIEAALKALNKHKAAFPITNY